MEADRVETLLRESRPEPRPGFTDELAEDLFPAKRAPGHARIPRPLLAAAATATAMAIGVLGHSLAGEGPLGGSDGGVKATDNCRDVKVIRRERVPYLVRSENGRTRIAFRYERKQRQVRRCP